MKKYFFCLLIIPTVAFANADEKSIKSIQSKYEQIKQLEPKMKVEKRAQASGESAEGSKAEIFRHKKEIKEIREEYFGESGKLKYTFFYDNGKVFFVLSQETTYSLPLMQPVPGKPEPYPTTASLCNS